MIKTSFLACESNFPSHPCSFFHTLCFVLSKLSFFFGPIKDGNRKHFSYYWTIRNPKACFIDSCIAKEVDLLKKRVVLSRLICCPEALSYVSKISSNFYQSLSFALQKIKLSYAKRRWISFGPLWEIESPLMSPKFSNFFNSP